jgi:hypothetical protein
MIYFDIRYSEAQRRPGRTATLSEGPSRRAPHACMLISFPPLSGHKRAPQRIHTKFKSPSCLSGACSHTIHSARHEPFAQGATSSSIECDCAYIGAHKPRTLRQQHCFSASSLNAAR